MLHENKEKMIVRTKLGEDKLKFTVTYLDGKKLPKDLAKRVGFAVENINEVDGLLSRFDELNNRNIDLLRKYCGLESEIQDLKQELEQVQLDSDNTEEFMRERIARLEQERSLLEINKAELLNVVKNLTWSFAIIGLLGLVCLGLYIFAL
jgi:vacuolar-type H+-ATPase subunit I/STV1